MSVGIKEEHRRIAAQLVAETRRLGGLAPVDLERFHADQAKAAADPFGRDIPQCALGLLGMAEACVFAELGLEENPDRYAADDAWRLELNRAYNDKAEKIVGRRPLPEKPRPPYGKHVPRSLHNIFEAHTVWKGGTVWLEQAAGNEKELAELLDRVERRLEDLRGFLLDDAWEAEKEGRRKLGMPLPVFRSLRGPVTFATSVYGVENLIFLLYDNPRLGERFRDLILRAMLGVGRVYDEEAGFTSANAPRGFSFSDDNCALLTADLYEAFGLPILKGALDRFSPGPGDLRFQHSDSDMEHLLPLLSRVNLNRVNLGPNVMVDTIRRHLPRAVILGELAPFTFSRNEEENLVAEFLRDFELAGDSRGLKFETAGAINNGSRLTGLRLVMAAIQRYGRYDGR